MVMTPLMRLALVRSFHVAELSCSERKLVGPLASSRQELKRDTQALLVISSKRKTAEDWLIVLGKFSWKLLFEPSQPDGDFESFSGEQMQQLIAESARTGGMSGVIEQKGRSREDSCGT